MKLLTKKIEHDLLSAWNTTEKSPTATPIIVKYFTPDAQATWYITEGEKLEGGDWRLPYRNRFGEAMLIVPSNTR